MVGIMLLIMLTLSTKKKMDSNSIRSKKFQRNGIKKVLSGCDDLEDDTKKCYPSYTTLVEAIDKEYSEKIKLQENKELNIKEKKINKSELKADPPTIAELLTAFKGDCELTVCQKSCADLIVILEDDDPVPKASDFLKLSKTCEVNDHNSGGSNGNIGFLSTKTSQFLLLFIFSTIGFYFKQ
jgi:hypothetical protein